MNCDSRPFSLANDSPRYAAKSKRSGQHCRTQPFTVRLFAIVRLKSLMNFSPRFLRVPILGLIPHFLVVTMSQEHAQGTHKCERQTLRSNIGASGIRSEPGQKGSSVPKT